MRAAEFGDDSSLVWSRDFGIDSTARCSFGPPSGGASLRPGTARTTSITRGEMSTILDRIVAAKRNEVARAKSLRPEDSVRRAAEMAPEPRDFFAALGDGPPIRLIAEVKRASPSAGLIRADFDPVTIAQTYTAHGAACISVLTDEPFFQGRLDYLTAVRQAVAAPVLRKDFVIDPYQVFEARAAGADAVLLIAECLDDAMLDRLFQLVVDWRMTPLVELYDEENLPRVLRLGARLVGINNRDLKSFRVDLEHTVRMRRKIPAEIRVVGESGIRTRADAERLESAGVQAMLVGESLMRQADVGRAVEELLGRRPAARAGGQNG